MKQIRILTTPNGVAEFLSDDEKADELKKKLQEGAANLITTTDSSFSWINIQNVMRIDIVEYIKPEEKTDTITVDSEINNEIP